MIKQPGMIQTEWKLEVLEKMGIGSGLVRVVCGFGSLLGGEPWYSIVEAVEFRSL